MDCHADVQSSMLGLGIFYILSEHAPDSATDDAEEADGVEEEDGEPLRQEVDGDVLMRTMEDLLSQQRDSFAMNPFKRVNPLFLLSSGR